MRWLYPPGAARRARRRERRASPERARATPRARRTRTNVKKIPSYSVVPSRASSRARVRRATSRAIAVRIARRSLPPIARDVANARARANDERRTRRRVGEKNTTRARSMDSSHCVRIVVVERDAPPQSTPISPRARRRRSSRDDGRSRCDDGRTCGERRRPWNRRNHEINGGGDALTSSSPTR